MGVKLKQIRVDGYKNLINCELNLGDFNVLVGPNNSGKTNLLEVLQMFGGACFQGEETRKEILSGLTPPPHRSNAICHLQRHKNKPLTIGIAFEVAAERKHFLVDYEVQIQFHIKEQKEKGGFIYEHLKARIPGKTGPWTEYIQRRGRDLKIRGKPHPIANDISSLQTIPALYPEFKGLDEEFRNFYLVLLWIGGMNYAAFSPTGLRENIDKEKDADAFRISSFDLLAVVDEIKGESDQYDLFKESLCDIMNLEKVNFNAFDVTDSKDKKGEQSSKRFRYLQAKRKDDILCSIEEYSDGTFNAAAILALLLSRKYRGPMFFLEEIENCLHPAAIQKMMTFLQDYADRWPVLITTHSSNVLNCVKNPEDVNVAVVDETGATHFEKIKTNKQLRGYLKDKFMSFGDMLPSNFEEVLGK